MAARKPKVVAETAAITVVEAADAVETPTLTSRKGTCPTCGKTFRFAGSIEKFHFVNFPTHNPDASVNPDAAVEDAPVAAPVASATGNTVTFAMTLGREVTFKNGRTVTFRTAAQKRALKAWEAQKAARAAARKARKAA